MKFNKVLIGLSLLSVCLSTGCQDKRFVANEKEVKQYFNQTTNTLEQPVNELKVGVDF